MMTKKDKEMQQLKEFCELKQKLKDYLRSGHSRPTTRRDFLSSGLIGASAYVAAPTLLQLISASAWGQESGEIAELCTGDESAGGNSRPLFIHLQLAGGPALYAQHAVAGPNGESLNSRDFGRGPNAEVVRAFSNNVPFYTSSRFYQSMQNQIGQAVDAELANKTSFVAVAAASRDDRSTNAQDPVGILAAAGLTGDRLSPLITSGNNRFEPAIPSLTAQMLRVNGSNDLNGALGVSGALGQMSGNTAQQLEVHSALANLVSDLSKEQVRQLASDPTSHASQKTFRDNVLCAMDQNHKNMSQASDVDFLDGDGPGIANGNAFRQAFNGINNGIGQACGAGFAGYTSSVSIQLTGYDYHNGRSRNQAEDKDAEAGNMVGALLRGAAAAGKDVFIMVSADGSVESNSNDDGSLAWSKDEGRRGMAYFIHYKASGPALQTSSFSSGNFSDADWQINHFVNREANSRTTLGDINSGSAVLGCAAFANYAAAIGQLNLMDSAAMAPVKAVLRGAAVSMGNPTNYLDAFVRFRS